MNRAFRNYVKSLSLVSFTLTSLYMLSSRYIVVCRPLHAKSICTLRRTRIAIVLVCLFALLYNGSRFFEYENEIRIIEDEKMNASVSLILIISIFNIASTPNTFSQTQL